jgi:hypothetical protein
VKYGYVYVSIYVAIVAIGIFTIYYFTASQSSNSSTPQFHYATKDCLHFEQKARELAENSIGQATMSSYNFHFDGIRCVWGSGTNGTSELQAIMVSYQSPDRGAITFTEDPSLTQVINSTVLPPERFGN